MTESLGLTTIEANQRRQRFGLNQLEVKKQDSLLEEFAESLLEPLQLLLVAVGVLYAVFGELRDAAIIFGVIITVAGVETWTEWRSGRAIAALTKLAAPQAQVWRDGSLRQSPPETLVPGDVIALAAGSRVPADVRLVEADELAVDESLVTGESTAVEHDMQPGHRELLAGSLVVRGRAMAEVTATGARSTLGRIAGLVSAEESPRTPLQRQMGELARALVVVALAVSVVIPVIGIITGQPVREMILTGLTLAFATIPEELPILIVIVLGLGSLQLARQHAIVRRLIAAETLGATTVICTDKTGTLTENRMTLAGSYPAAELLGNQEHPDGDARFLLHVARLASEPPSVTAASFVDPIDAAIWKVDGSGTSPKIERRFPFDTGRRVASAMEGGNGQFLLGVKGAPEAILQRSSRWRSVSGPKPLLATDRESVLAAARRQAAAGGRVLAVASRELPSKPIERDAAERDLTLEGLVVLNDPRRPEVPEAVQEVRSAGVSVSIVTGDQAGTAVAVAQAAGLVLPVFGPDAISGFDGAELAARAKAGAIFARTQPADKLRIVHSLTTAGEVVAVTGDGVNDAPALRAATIGVAMGRGGTDVAREAADLVMADDNFATLVRAMAEGRRLYDNLRKAVRYYLAVKVALITVSLAAALAHLPLPFAPLQIVILELFMDLGASLAFVSQFAEDDIMRRPPRRPNAPFLDRSMLLGIVAGGLTLAAITGAAFLAGLSRYRVDSARTLALVAWLVGHAVLGVVMSWERRPVSLHGLLANRALIGWAAAAVTFAAAITVIPPLREALHAGPVPALSAALVGLLAALGPLWLELVKRRATFAWGFAGRR